MKWSVFACFSLLVACSSPGPGGVATGECVAFDAGPKGVAPPDGGESGPATDGPVVTKADVDAIFDLSCAFTSCHGAKPGKANLFIPKHTSGNWYSNVVNVASTTHNSMKRVVPYDPQNSFLAWKLTDGICALSKDCKDGTCGDRMPQDNDALDPADRDKIIEWIRQGAKE